MYVAEYKNKQKIKHFKNVETAANSWKSYLFLENFLWA